MAGTRISVALSGGASLGAYQAGAMAALVVAVEAVRDEDPDALALDSLGGASAGALVALMTATAHAAGLDPVETLRTGWVEEVDLPLLLDHAGPAPLGQDDLRQRMGTFLAGSKVVREPSATDPIALHVALSGLRGLTYGVDGLRGGGSVPASTYADWVRRTVDPGIDPATVFEPQDASLGDAALASAANPGVFPARLLDRSADLGCYAAQGIVDVPDHGRLWFSDGGMMQTDPIGRVLAAAAAVHGDAGEARVALLVDPRSEGPTTGRRFGDPDHEPSWLGALSRALSILPAQVLYRDLRRVVRDNDRLSLARELRDVLAPVLERDEQARAALAELVRRRTGDTIDGDDPRTLLGAALADVGGLQGKRHVDVDVLSPLLLADGEQDGIDSLLAGEILGDLGGFLERDLRASDFVLGCATTLAWLEPGLGALDLDPLLVQRAVEAVEAAHDHDWRGANVGQVEVDDLPNRARFRLAELGVSAALGIVRQTVSAADPGTAVANGWSRLRERVRRSE